MEEHFDFAFAPAYRLPALLLGITPLTSGVTLSADRLHVRYGPWSLDTPTSNVREVSITGGFAWHRTAGPPHLSLTDRGVSFTTNGERAVCVQFHEPVKALDPTGRLVRHPGATLTVDRVDDLHSRLRHHVDR
ncbi:hypothetical protein [Nocardioides coralli]|uniref:hypothetical protein n=1 Tax=Nocardioides coralli TaxID=2872154 RepID=UPI001CA3B18A|nr:hypothetical protein [Nocardioides coralli]QZY30363.1 hypothetical protein K6T13_06815 [Nocardioides coralli]